MRPAIAQDLHQVYVEAFTAAQRARDHGRNYVAVVQRKNAEFGFQFIATNDLKQCHASLGSGGVAVAAQNILYGLACDSPVTVAFNPWDVDEYLDQLGGGGFVPSCPFCEAAI